MCLEYLGYVILYWYVSHNLLYYVYFINLNTDQVFPMKTAHKLRCEVIAKYALDSKVLVQKMQNIPIILTLITC